MPWSADELRMKGRKDDRGSKQQLQGRGKGKQGSRAGEQQHQQQEGCEAHKHTSMQTVGGDPAGVLATAGGATAAGDGGHAVQSTASALQGSLMGNAAPAPAAAAATAAAAAAESMERAVKELVAAMNVDK
eukprot:scaffold31710_cov22-Tisochrysis_lutea.AAC.1